MLRTLLAGLLVLAIAADAAAQTTPARRAATKTTTRKTAAKRPAAKPMAQPAPQTGGRNDIGPGGNGAVGSTEAADGKGQNAYAAPGMPINIDNPKKVEGYNGPAPTKPRSRTTLTPR